MAAKESKKIFIGPGEGAHLPVLNITHKVTAESFGGAFTIIEVGLLPGEMIPPHTHTREDECAFVLEGELTFDVGGEIVVDPSRLVRSQAERGLPRFLQHGHGAEPAPGNTYPR